MLDVKKDDYRNKASLEFFLSVLYAYDKLPDSTDYAIKQAIIARNANEEIKVNKIIIFINMQEL